MLNVAVLNLEEDHLADFPHRRAPDLGSCPYPKAKVRQNLNPSAPRPPATSHLRPRRPALGYPPQWLCAPHLRARSEGQRAQRETELSRTLVPPSPARRVCWGCSPTCPRFLPFLLPPKASPWYVPADRLAACKGVSPPREDLMELSLARELLSCELSTISTAASRSRQRDESLPRINAAISRRGVPGEAQSPRDADAKGGRTPTRGHSLGPRRLAGCSPNPTWLWGPALCELSLTPRTRRERDPSKTHFLHQGRKFCCNWKQSKARSLLAKEA